MSKKILTGGLLLATLAAFVPANLANADADVRFGIDVKYNLFNNTKIDLDGSIEGVVDNKGGYADETKKFMHMISVIMSENKLRVQPADFGVQANVKYYMDVMSGIKIGIQAGVSTGISATSQKLKDAKITSTSTKDAATSLFALEKDKDGKAIAAALSDKDKTASITLAHSGNDKFLNVNGKKAMLTLNSKDETLEGIIAFDAAEEVTMTSKETAVQKLIDAGFSQYAREQLLPSNASDDVKKKLAAMDLGTLAKFLAATSDNGVVGSTATNPGFQLNSPAGVTTNSSAGTALVLNPALHASGAFGTVHLNSAIANKMSLGDLLLTQSAVADNSTSAQYQSLQNNMLAQAALSTVPDVISFKDVEGIVKDNKILDIPKFAERFLKNAAAKLDLALTSEAAANLKRAGSTTLVNESIMNMFKLASEQGIKLADGDLAAIGLTKQAGDTSNYYLLIVENENESFSPVVIKGGDKGELFGEAVMLEDFDANGTLTEAQFDAKQKILVKNVKKRELVGASLGAVAEFRGNEGMMKNLALEVGVNGKYGYYTTTADFELEGTGTSSIKSLTAAQVALGEMDVDALTSGQFAASIDSKETMKALSDIKSTSGGSVSTKNSDGSSASKQTAKLRNHAFGAGAELAVKYFITEQVAAKFGIGVTLMHHLSAEEKATKSTDTTAVKNVIKFNKKELEKKNEVTLSAILGIEVAV